MEAWRKAVPDEIPREVRVAAVLDQPRLRYRRLRPLQHLDGDQTCRLTATNLGQALFDPSVRSLEWRPCPGNTSPSRRSLSTFSASVSSILRSPWTPSTVRSRTRGWSPSVSGTSSTTLPGSTRGRPQRPRLLVPAARRRRHQQDLLRRRLATAGDPARADPRPVAARPRPDAGRAASRRLVQDQDPRHAGQPQADPGDRQADVLPHRREHRAAGRARVQPDQRRA